MLVAQPGRDSLPQYLLPEPILICYDDDGKRYLWAVSKTSPEANPLCDLLAIVTSNNTAPTLQDIKNATTFFYGSEVDAGYSNCGLLPFDKRVDGAKERARNTNLEA